MYARRVDFIGDTTLYRGEAAPGSAESSEAWRIRKIVFTGDDVSETWAGGTDAFQHAWTNRLSLSYS